MRRIIFVAAALAAMSAIGHAEPARLGNDQLDQVTGGTTDIRSLNVNVTGSRAVVREERNVDGKVTKRYAVLKKKDGEWVYVRGSRSLARQFKQGKFGVVQIPSIHVPGVTIDFGSLGSVR